MVVMTLNASKILVTHCNNSAVWKKILPIKIILLFQNYNKYLPDVKAILYCDKSWKMARKIRLGILYSLWQTSRAKVKTRPPLSIFPCCCRHDINRREEKQLYSRIWADPVYCRVNNSLNIVHIGIEGCVYVTKLFPIQNSVTGWCKENCNILFTFSLKKNIFLS